jgi:hypothetical protein
MADQERIWTAALLVIGDEILSGRTQDKNVAQIALWLNMQGIASAEVRVVADRHGGDRRCRDALRAGNDYLFTPAASARRMTTSPSTRSPRRWACRWSCMRVRARSSRCIMPRAAG